MLINSLNCIFISSLVDSFPLFTIYIKIENKLIVEIVDYITKLNDIGILKCFIIAYICIYSFIIILLGTIYFINNLVDPLIEHLEQELEKQWYWEEPTHYRNGLDYLPNLKLSIDKIRKKAEDGLARLREREKIEKQKLEEQQRKIEENRIKNQQYLEERRKNPWTEEEKKRELDFLLSEMHKTYGHLFDNTEDSESTDD